MGQARVVMWGGRGAGGHLGEGASSTWSRANSGGGSSGAGGARRDYLEGGEEAAGRGGRGGSWGLSNLGLILSCVHFTLFGGGTIWGRVGGRVVVLGALWASRACGFGGGVVIPTVGTVGGGGGAAVGNGAEVALFGAGGVGAPMLGLLVV